MNADFLLSSDARKSATIRSNLNCNRTPRGELTLHRDSFGKVRTLKSQAFVRNCAQDLVARHVEHPKLVIREIFHPAIWTIREACQTDILGEYECSSRLRRIKTHTCEGVVLKISDSLLNKIPRAFRMNDFAFVSFDSPFALVNPQMPGPIPMVSLSNSWSEIEREKASPPEPSPPRLFAQRRVKILVYV